MKKTIEFGDRLISVQMPATPEGYALWHVGGGIRSITVGKLPGPMGYYLTAQITFDDDRADIVIPLHMAERFEIQYGD